MSPKVNRTLPPRRQGIHPISPRTTSEGRGSGAPSVIDRIAPIGFDDDDGIKMLVYGRSGTGKTTLWATFPKPILAIIASGGNRPGELRSINTPELRKVVSQVVLRDSKELMTLTEHESITEFATVVLDHITALQDLVLKEVLGLQDVPAQKTWGLATQQQYGQVTLQCKDLLRGLLSLKSNVVLVAQEREFNTDSEGDLIAPAVGAGLTPSLCGWVNSVCDYIVQTFLRQREKIQVKDVNGKKQEMRVKTKEVEYCLRTGPHPVYTAKFRLPRGVPLPDAIVDADYDKIMSLIRGTGTSVSLSREGGPVE